MDAPFQVSVINCVDEIDDQSFIESMMNQLHAKVSEHLKQAPEYFKSADLDIKLTKCIARHFPNEIRWNFEVEISGFINEREFTHTVQLQGSEIGSRKKYSMNQYVNLMNLASDVASDVKNLISKEYDSEEDFIHTGNHKRISDAKFNFVLKILLELNRHVSRQPGQYSSRWRKFRKGRWYLALLIFLATLITMSVNKIFFQHQEWDLTLALMIFYVCPMMMSVLGFIMTHCLGYLIMPSRFFQTELPGQIALRHTGCSSILVVRFFAFIIFCSVLYGTILLARSMLFQW